MPLDKFYDNDVFKSHRIGTTKVFLFIPKFCFISNKFMWLKFAYKQTAMFTGPGDPILEDRWYDQKEFLIAKLKGEL